MDTGTSAVLRVDIEEKMRSAFLSYAVSVITARALPDVRDGLKPGQRRIMYALHDMGIRHDRPTRKSARIVGEVLGKYHPHGDQAVYDAMVRMAQDFSMRYPLVEGQGNFGSVDGDDAAAMRYTEARLEQVGEEMLLDLAKNTVDFQDNFDGSLQEPTVLPSRLPNLLVNGVGGIAVGMATNIPPHNLGEIVDAVAYVVDRYDKIDDITVDDLMKFVKGPDFPTAGTIHGREGIRQAYATGKGRITVRALAHMEDMGQGKSAIIVTEIPYQVNKATLVERIAKLVRDERVDGIADLRDESDRTGMRIVIELKRNVDEGPLMESLLKYTQLQTTFGVNMLALVDGEPRTLTLKRCLTHYVDHRFQVIERRTVHDLERARARAHILEGLLVALDNLDEVINTIRRSKTADSARTNLRRKFKLSEAQATAILDMQLRRLAALERRKIQEEYKEVQARIAYLEGLLNDDKKILGIIKEDAIEIKRLFGDARRTSIQDEQASQSDGFEVASMVPSEDVYALLTRGGKIRRLPQEAYRSRRTTVPGMRSSERDVMQAVLLANAQDSICIVTDKGNAFCLPAHQLPDGDQQPGGLPVGQLVRLQDDEWPVAMFTRTGMEDATLALATANGKAKRLNPGDLDRLSRTPTAIMGLNGDDAVVSAMLAPAGSEAILVTRQGKAIRIALEAVRPQGLGAAGVGGISLQDGDIVIGMDLVREDGSLIIATASGFCKRVSISEYGTQGRNGQGVLTVDAAKEKDAGEIVAMCTVGKEDEVILVGSRHRMVRLALGDIPKLGRSTWGRLVTRTKRNALLKDGDAPAIGLVALSGLAQTKTTRSTRTSSKPRASAAKSSASKGKSSSSRSKKASPNKSSTAKRKTTRSSSTPRETTRTKSATPKSSTTGKTSTKAKPEPNAEAEPTRRRRSSTRSAKPKAESATGQDAAAKPSNATADQPKPSSSTRRSRSRRTTTRKPPTRRKKSE